MNGFTMDHKKVEQTKKFGDKKRHNFTRKIWYVIFVRKKGHDRDTCCKLHSIPDWYKEMADKKPIMTANVAGDETVKENQKHERMEFDLKTYI